MGVGVYAARCDVRDRARGRALRRPRPEQRLGGVHYLVNNAGIANDGALWRLSDEAWREVLDTNVTGAFNCIRAVAPIFRRQHYGKIVSVSAHQADRPGLRRGQLRREQGGAARPHPRGRRRARPGQRERQRGGPGIHPHRADGACCPREVIERAQKSSVLGRVAEPDDVAHVVSFLCSESARHITGQTIVVDGGLSLE